MEHPKFEAYKTYLKNAYNKLVYNTSHDQVVKNMVTFRALNEIINDDSMITTIAEAEAFGKRLQILGRKVKRADKKKNNMINLLNIEH